MEQSIDKRKATGTLLGQDAYKTEAGSAFTLSGIGAYRAGDIEKEYEKLLNNPDRVEIPGEKK